MQNGGQQQNGAYVTQQTVGVFEHAEDVFNRLDSGDLDVAVAGKMTNALRVQVAQSRLEFDHAKSTNRLRDGSPELPGFVRTPGVQSPPAQPQAHRGRGR